MKPFSNLAPWPPLQKLWDYFFHVVDNFMIMVLILLIGWLVARLFRWTIHGFLRLVYFNRFAYRIGFTLALARAGINTEPAALVSVVAFYFVFLIFLLLGLSALGSRTIDAFILQLSTYLPRLVVAFLILFAGYIISAFVNRTVLIAAVNANVKFARGLAAAGQMLVFFFFLAVGLEQAGIGKDIVVATFSILFGGVVLALALAFGFGGRDLARGILEQHLRQPEQKSKRQPEPEMDEISHL